MVTFKLSNGEGVKQWGSWHNEIVQQNNREMALRKCQIGA